MTGGDGDDDDGDEKKSGDSSSTPQHSSLEGSISSFKQFFSNYWIYVSHTVPIDRNSLHDCAAARNSGIERAGRGQANCCHPPYLFFTNETDPSAPTALALTGKIHFHELRCFSRTQLSALSCHRCQQNEQRSVIRQQNSDSIRS